MPSMLGFRPRLMLHGGVYRHSGADGGARVADWAACARRAKT